MKSIGKFAWILFLPFLLSCSIVSFLVPPFPANSFVEGLWVPSDYTLDFMDQSGYEFSTHSIEFLTDGTVIITNIPSAWLFQNSSNGMDFYSGIGTWFLSEQEVTNTSDIHPTIQISTLDENEASVEFGTVLEYIEFIPVNNPTEVNWVTFQKCYPHLHITDDLLEPLVKSLIQSPRDTLGFSAITFDDRIEIDGTIGESDIWLDAYSDFSSHDIIFRLQNQEYIWVFEQENFYGPEKWVDYDGSLWEETITLQYQTEYINGGPINDLMIDYTGHDARLINQSNNWYLSNNINDVMPILEEWRQWRVNEPPSPQSLCP